MKQIIVALSMAALFSGLSGCVNSTVTAAQHAQDHAQHQAYLETIYTKYDSEYVDDCLAHSELVCEFE